MSSIPTELENLYQRYFGSRPVVVVPPPSSPASDASVPTRNASSGYPVLSNRGAVLADQYLNTEIWLPITLRALGPGFVNAKNGTVGEWYLPYATVNISGSADYIKTPLNQRKGSVKELFSIDDYGISIKGFFIDKQNRSFPEAEIGYLKKLHEAGTTFKIENAITNILLEDATLPPDQQYRVIIEKFDLPEVTGGKKSMRPFSMQLCSDYIFTLTLA